MPRIVASGSQIPQSLRYQTMTVPRTTISPWEKLVRPVVPKISERPMAIMARTRPNFTPSTVSWRNWSKRLDCSRELTAPSSWRAKSTRWVSCGLTWTVRVSVSGSTSSTPSGRVVGVDGHGVLARARHLEQEQRRRRRSRRRRCLVADAGHGERDAFGRGLHRVGALAHVVGEGGGDGRAPRPAASSPAPEPSVGSQNGQGTGDDDRGEYHRPDAQRLCRLPSAHPSGGRRGV